VAHVVAHPHNVCYMFSICLDFYVVFRGRQSTQLYYLSKIQIPLAKSYSSTTATVLTFMYRNIQHGVM